MKFGVILLLLTLPSSRAFTQVDSLLSILKSTPGVTHEEIQKLNDISKQLVRTSPTLSKMFASKALDQSVKYGFRYEQLVAYENMAELHRTKSNLTKALEYAFDAFHIAEELQDSLLMAKSAYNIGRYYADIENWAKTQEYYDLALKFNNGDLKLTGDILNSIGTMFEGYEEYDSSLDYYQQSLTLREEIKDEEGLGASYSNMGIIYFRRFNDTEKALSFYKRSTELKKKLNDFFNLAYTYINIGNLYRDTKKFDLARVNYKIALAYADSAEAKGVKASCYQRLARCEEMAGNLALSKEYTEKSLNLRIEVLQERQNTEVEQLEAAYNLQKNESALLISQQQVELLRKDKTILIIQVALLILFLILLLVFFFLKRAKANRDKQLRLKENEMLKREIEHKNNELSSFVMNLVQKQEMMDSLNVVVTNMKAGTEDEVLVKHIRELDQIIQKQTRNDKEWEDFRVYFEKIHNNFFKNLKSQFPELSVTELRLAALIKLKLSIKETATILGIAPDSVKTSRYRLRAKLNLQRDQNLLDFLSEYE